jgi:hypothetical protein
MQVLPPCRTTERAQVPLIGRLRPVPRFCHHTPFRAATEAKTSAPLCQMPSRPLRKVDLLTRRKPPQHRPPWRRGRLAQHRSRRAPSSPRHKPRDPCAVLRVSRNAPEGPRTPRSVCSASLSQLESHDAEWLYAESLWSCGIRYKHIDYPVLRHTQVHEDGNNSQYNLQGTAVSNTKSAGRTLGG